MDRDDGRFVTELLDRARVQMGDSARTLIGPTIRAFRLHGLRHWLARERDAFVQTAKAALAAAIAWEIASSVFRLYDPVLASVAALVVVQVTVYQSVRRAIQYSAGIVAGMTAALAIGTYLGINMLTLCLIVVLSLTVGRTLRLGTQVNQVATTGLLVLAFGSHYGKWRIVDSVIGAAIGVVVNMLIAPPSFTRTAAKEIADLADDLAGLCTRCAKGLREDSGERNSGEVERAATSANSAAVSSELSAVLAAEPAASAAATVSATSATVTPSAAAPKSSAMTSLSAATSPASATTPPAATPRSAMPSPPSTTAPPAPISPAAMASPPAASPLASATSPSVATSPTSATTPPAATSPSAATSSASTTSTSSTTEQRDQQWRHTQAQDWLARSRSLARSARSTRQVAQQAEESIRYHPRKSMHQAGVHQVDEAAIALDHVATQLNSVMRGLADLRGGSSGIPSEHSRVPEELVLLLEDTAKALNAYGRLQLPDRASPRVYEELSQLISSSKPHAREAAEALHPDDDDPTMLWSIHGALLDDTRRMLRELDPDNGPHREGIPAAIRSYMVHPAR